MMLLVLVIMLLRYVIVESSIWKFSLALSIARGTASSSRETSAQEAHEDIRQDDRFLRLFEITQQGLLYSRTVVVMAIQNNSFLISYGQLNASSLLLNEDKPVTILNGCKYILISTGLAGDCNMVRKYIKMKILNYSDEFDNYPSSLLVANELGKLFVNYRDLPRNRPLIVHNYLIDKENGLIYDINGLGLVETIVAGTIGSNREYGLQVLEDSYSPDISIEKAKNIAENIIRHRDNRIRESLDDLEVPSIQIVHQLL